MKHFDLLNQLEFWDDNPHAEPLLLADWGRILRFMLKPGQSIREHRAPNSPFIVVVLKGSGVFTGGDGQEIQVKAGSLLVFDTGETHSVRALDEELVFVGFLHPAPGTTPGKVSGTMATQQ